MSKSKSSDKKAGQNKPDFHFVFGKKNYQLMLIGIVVIVIGFALMVGTENIYDFRKTTLAPIVVIAGFVIEVFAILKRPDSEDESN
ncbi:MAG: DUF3098 domain-containing protein [Bacteroidia bacterium]